MLSRILPVEARHKNHQSYHARHIFRGRAVSIVARLRCCIDHPNKQSFHGTSTITCSSFHHRCLKDSTVTKVSGIGRFVNESRTKSRVCPALSNSLRSGYARCRSCLRYPTAIPSLRRQQSTLCYLYRFDMVSWRSSILFLIIIRN